MKFVTNPQLILTQDEFKTLDNALKLCRDMDEQTGDSESGSCKACPFNDDCSYFCNDCVYRTAHTTLKKIIDVAIVK